MKKNAKEKVETYLDLGHNQVENHAKAQQKIYDRKTSEESTVTRKLSEFFKTNVIGFAWHYLRSRFGQRHPYLCYPKGDDNGCYPLLPALPKTELVTLALLSDWASDTIESDRVAELVAQRRPDYSIHLGDVYFVGTEKEVYENFTAPYASWYYGGSGSLALPGNHEMYSNGKAYFRHLLPAMYASDGKVKHTQKAGFFCLENQYWRIIGLDTGYTSVERPFVEIIRPPDCHLRKEQIDWLRDVVRIGDASDRRGIVLLSHHPYFSAFREAYPVPAQQIKELMGDAARPLIWFWGHDHRLVIYNKTQQENGPEVYGRCIGHGGMPVEIEWPGKEAEREKIQFYDTRVRTVVKRHRLGYNGFVLLNLQGSQLEAQYIDLDDKLVAKEQWVLNAQNGQLEWEFIESLSSLAD
ncbi:metallophosphoesterase family protein [Dyadobacter tibetensis]|uniref:metallophosphoesterase family protein n=1 Tax=Dyadobacter tibetensis TaxID=1211851 RepID=UPI00046F51C0|nr:metallophosphoesterase [Dyadobacter tibetensis]